MMPWELCSLVRAGREVEVRTRGVYRGRRGRVIGSLTTKGDPLCNEAITAMHLYALDLGECDAAGDVNACDFRRYEFRVLAAPRPPRRVAKPCPGPAPGP